MEAYLQHGEGTEGPFRTESVEIRTRPKHSKVKTEHQVKWEGRWLIVWFNEVTGKHYIIPKGFGQLAANTIKVQIVGG